MLTSKRTLFKLAAFGAVGAVGLGGTAALAAPDSGPPTSPHALADGREITFADPWSAHEVVTEVGLVDGLMLVSDSATLTVGYLGTPTSAGEFADAVVAAALPDPSLAPPVAGGASSFVGADGATTSDVEYQINVFTEETGEQTGILVQTVNQIDVTVLVAPIAELGSFITSAQATVAVDGTPVLPGIEGSEIQGDLDASLDGAQPEGTGAAIGTDAAERGEFVDATGGLTISWPADWTVESSNDEGTVIVHPTGAFKIYTSVYALEGATWAEMAQTDVDFLVGDQGPNATVVGPTVTDDGFYFATNGEFGLRLAEGVGIATDPERYILLFVGDSAAGADPSAIIADVQAAILLNGAAPFQGMATLFEAPAS